MSKVFDKITDQDLNEINKILSAAGSSDNKVAIPAQEKLVSAISTPLRQAVLPGDIVGDLFQIETYAPGTAVEYPIDLIRPGSEGDFIAYTMPDHGEIPMRRVAGDRLMVPTYRIANSIDCQLRFLRNANWNVVRRMMEVLEAGFISKLNDDAFSTLIQSGVARNIMVYDADAVQGNFTPRLVSLMKTAMRRNGGGNSTSVNRGQLTDLYVSPEALDDIRAWNLSLIPDQVRTNIYYASDNGNEIIKIYGVSLHDIDELGVSQKYQNFYTGTLGKSLSADVELVIGVDKKNKDSFVMPKVQDLQTYEDNTVHRQGLFSLYADMEIGFACLDARRVLLGSF